MAVPAKLFLQRELALVDVDVTCAEAASAAVEVLVVDGLTFDRERFFLVRLHGLPDTPLLGSELTLTAIVQLAGLAPDEVVVQAVVGRIDATDSISELTTVSMARTGTADDGHEVFSATTSLPAAGPVGYTVRVLKRAGYATVTASSARSRRAERIGRPPSAGTG